MNHLNCSFAKVAAAALLAAIGFALAPTLIDPSVAPAATMSGDASHSWLAGAFPTGQASFARSASHGS